MKGGTYTGLDWLGLRLSHIFKVTLLGNENIKMNAAWKKSFYIHLYMQPESPIFLPYQRCNLYQSLQCLTLPGVLDVQFFSHTRWFHPLTPTSPQDTVVMWELREGTTMHSKGLTLGTFKYQRDWRSLQSWNRGKIRDLGHLRGEYTTSFIAETCFDSSWNLSGSLFFIFFKRGPFITIGLISFHCTLPYFNMKLLLHFVSLICRAIKRKKSEEQKNGCIIIMERFYL